MQSPRRVMPTTRRPGPDGCPPAPPGGLSAVFVPAGDDADTDAMIRAAVATTDAFTDRFNARDLAGMDALLHFPHVILSGEELIVWEAPGRMPSTFFEDLERTTGWVRTTYVERRAVLVNVRKVHLVVDYTRDRADGSVISRHRNLWIVTWDEGRWGIKQRSY